MARAEGRLEEALALGSGAAAVARAASETNQSVKLAIVEAIEAAIGPNERETAEELVASIEAVPPGLRSTGDESTLDEAREIFERLAAAPWLERVARAAGSPVRPHRPARPSDRQRLLDRAPEGERIPGGWE